MTNQHPITPPPELVRQWEKDCNIETLTPTALGKALRLAAQWGYEQHEKMLLDAMHSIVPQPYIEEDDDD